MVRVQRAEAAGSTRTSFVETLNDVVVVFTPQITGVDSHRELVKGVPAYAQINLVQSAIAIIAAGGIDGLGRSVFIRYLALG